MGTALSGGVLHRGPVTLTFGSGEIAYVSECEIRPVATVIKAPSVESASGPLDISETDRGMIFAIKDPSCKLETMAAWLGISTNHIVAGIGGGSVLTADNTDTSVDTGSASASWRRRDGTTMRVYIVKAAKYTGAGAAKIGKGEYAVFDYLVESLDPGDGSQQPYRIEQGVS